MSKEIKKETIEEAAENHWKMQYIMSLDESTKPYIIQDFIAGANWQSKRMFSEEDVLEAIRLARLKHPNYTDFYTKEQIIEKLKTK